MAYNLFATFSFVLTQFIFASPWLADFLINKMKLVIFAIALLLLMLVTPDFGLKRDDGDEQPSAHLCKPDDLTSLAGKDTDRIAKQSFTTNLVKRKLFSDFYSLPFKSKLFFKELNWTTFAQNRFTINTCTQKWSTATVWNCIEKENFHVTVSETLPIVRMRSRCGEEVEERENSPRRGRSERGVLWKPFFRCPLIMG